MPYTGYVEVGSNTANVYFGDTTAMLPSTCATTIGNCTIIDCTYATSNQDAAVPSQYSAGDVTLTAASGGSAVMSYDDSKAAYPEPFKSIPLVGGDMVQVSAAGDTIHPFSTSILVPNEVVLTAPVGNQNVFTIDPSVDLTLTWTNGNAGSTIQVQAGSYEPASNSYQEVICEFDAAAGTATIPASALAHLGSLENGSFGVYPRTVTTAECDNASVKIYATGSYTGGTLKSR
jgi:hypothetical protein